MKLKNLYSFVAAVAAGTLCIGQASATEVINKTLECSVENVKSEPAAFGNGIDVQMNYQDGDLIVTCNNIFPKINHLEGRVAHTVSGAIQNGVLCIFLSAAIQCEDENKTPDIIIGGPAPEVGKTYPHFSVTYRFKDVPEGDYQTFIIPNMHNATRMTNALSLPTAGNITFTADTSYGSYVNEDYEWVLENAAATSDSDKFYRLRFHGVDDSNRFRTPVHKLYLYQGLTPDFNSDPVIAYFDDEAMEIFCFPADIDIPSSFWGAGLDKATINPAKDLIRQNADSDMVTPSQVYQAVYSLCSPEPTESESPRYWYDTFSETMRPLYYRSATIENIGGQLLQHITLNDCSLSNPDGQVKGEWIQGIGAVGDWYASNLPYPIYDLPEGVKPTKLAYVRKLSTNEVIYGDASGDPGYATMKGIGNDSRFIWNDTEQTISVSHSSNITLTIFSSDGTKITESSRTGTVEINKHQLTPGIYIATASADGTTNHHKFIVK